MASDAPGTQFLFQASALETFKEVSTKNCVETVFVIIANHEQLECPSKGA